MMRSGSGASAPTSPIRAWDVEDIHSIHSSTMDGHREAPLPVNRLAKQVLGIQTLQVVSNKLAAFADFFAIEVHVGTDAN